MSHADRIEASHAHEERWEGQLTSEQVTDLLLEGLRADLCPHRRYGVRLELKTGLVRSGETPPEVKFTLIYDHDWANKPDDEGE